MNTIHSNFLMSAFLNLSERSMEERISKSDYLKVEK